MADHRTAYTLAALALAMDDADRERILKDDSYTHLWRLKDHLNVVAGAVGRAIAAREIDALAGTR